MYQYRTSKPHQCAKCGETFFPPKCNLAKGNGRYCSKRCAYDSLPRIPAAVRFWKYVQKTDSCWIWTGSHTRGHGQLVGDRDQPRKRRMVYAHRLSWEMHRGPIPDGMEVCHNCPGGDNGLCVNPDHLYLGTTRQNIADSVRKGLHCYGERSPHAKLTAEQVTEIRKRYATTIISHQRLAEEYGVTNTTIRQVIERTSWKHVP